MPPRLAHLALAVAGTLLVLVLALCWRGALRPGAGPRWRRRLVAAGLGFLTALGFGLPAASCAKDPPAAQAGGALETSREWKRIRSLVADAEEIDSGKRGEYPFSRAERDRLWKRFDDASKDLDALVAARLLDRAEADLYAQWLGSLQSGLHRFRTTDMRMATCYEPMRPPDWADRSEHTVEQLKTRMPLVRSVLEQKTVHPDVVRKVLELLAQDRHTLSQNPDLRPEQRKALDEVSAAIAALEQRL